jgi:CRP/FNR family cyclic AMP-dependent transcriptional regulator
VETQNTAKQSAPNPDRAEFDEVVADLPLASYSTGEVVLSAGSKSGRLLILKKGAVAILKDSIEIARVKEPGAVFGEISALLDKPHTADVRALEDSQFHVADASLLVKDPVSVLHIARILAQRLVAADEGLIELKNQLRAGHSPGTLGKLIGKIEEVLIGSVDKHFQAPPGCNL